MTITRITPFATDKNFGKAINDACERFNDDEWILLTDGDINFLTPNWGRQIAEVIEKNDYSLYGCVTNRLAMPTQRHNGEFSDNHDMLHHCEIAKQRETDRWCEVTDITSKKIVAGMFMLFPKTLWNKIKFQEKTLHFDSLFSKAVVAQGGRLGLIEGLYAYHFYRGWSDNPRFDVSHLQR